MTAVLRASPDSNAAEGYVRKLRRSLDGTLGPSALVGGPTAEAVDIADRINSRTPSVVLGIVLIEFILVTAAFQAPIIALKAMITTLLSVGAALGILTVIFGGAGSLAYFVPLFLFAAVFGLSTDYEIFLLSRIREHYRGGVVHRRERRRGPGQERKVDHAGRRHDECRLLRAGHLSAGSV